MAGESAQVGFSILEWVTVVEIPAMAGLLTLFLKHQSDDVKKATEHERQVADLRLEAQKLVNEARESAVNGLNQYKLEAMKQFASVDHLQEVEGRLIRHLEKIEAKLDTALKD